MKTSYIYLITCESNLKYYVGQHKWDGEGLDPDYFCSSSNPEFWEDVRTYGRSEFRTTILEFVEDDKLNEAERRWIEAYRTKYGWSQVYNISDGGGSWAHVNRNPENSKRALESNRSNHGGVLAWNTKEAIKKSQLTRSETYDGDCMGACHSEDSIRKRLETQRLNGSMDEHMILMRNKAASKESRTKAVSKNTEKYIYYTGSKYIVANKTLAGWNLKGYKRLCKLSEKDSYEASHGISIILE